MTDYVTPTEFAHGDYVAAAALTRWNTALTHIYEIAPSVQINTPVAEMDTGDRVSFTHRQRWLYYKSSGAILDPAGIEDDVSLPNTSDNWVNEYDLDSISWLGYGATYYVSGVDFAVEDED